jgi:hypothetical protein
MKGVFKILWLVLFVFVIISINCRRTFNWEPSGQQIGEIEYAANTVFLHIEDLMLLEEVTDNALVFSGQSDNLTKIEEGDILLLGVSDNTPYGLLRKVESVQNNGTGFEFKTSHADLTDAIISGTISFSRKLVEKDFTLISKSAGVLAKGQDKSFDGLAVTMDKFEIYMDGIHSALLNGSIGVSSEINITIVFESSSVKRIDVSTQLSKIDELIFSSTGSFSGPKELELAEFLHVPVVIDSIVFVPLVVMKCRQEGITNSGELSGIRQEREIISNLKFESNQWSSEPFTHTEYIDTLDPQIVTNTHLTLFSGPEVNIMLLGDTIQSVYADSYYELEANATEANGWKISLGLIGTNVIKGDILGLNKDYSSDFEVQ